MQNETVTRATEARLRSIVQTAEGRGRFSHRRLDAVEALADLYARQGRLREAEPLRVELVSLKEKIYGPEHPSLAPILVELSRYYTDMGRLPEAEAVLRIALKIDERDAVQRSAFIAQDLLALSRVLSLVGKTAEAELHLARAERITAIVFGEEQVEMARFLLARGDFESAGERPNRARACYARAEKIIGRALGESHAELAEVWVRLGHLERAAGRAREAAVFYARSLSAHETKDGERGLDASADLIHLGLMSLAGGLPKQALGRFQEALAIREDLLESGHPAVAEALASVGEAWAALRRWERSETAYLRAWSLLENSLGRQAPALLRVWEQLAELYYTRACYPEADRLLVHVSKAIRGVFGPRHPAAATAVRNLIQSYEAQDRAEEADALRKQLVTAGAAPAHAA